MKEPKHRTVRIYSRLRPLRLAFLVPPNNRKILRKVFQINTCLWGGMYNPIIPIYRRTPKWWSERPFPTPSARDIISGYLDAFEPDYIVIMEKGLDEGLNYPENRILPFDELLNPEAGTPFSLGLDVLDVYKEFFKQELKFIRRYKFDIVLPAAKIQRMRLFVSACFGEFTEKDRLRYLQDAYTNILEATELTIEPTNLYKPFLVHGCLYPLSIGMFNIKALSRGWIPEPVLFFMDATSPDDLIDFWNLRAIGRQVLPLPKQWTNYLVENCSKIIARNYRPGKSDKEFERGTTLLCSRSCSPRELMEFGKSLESPGMGAIRAQKWYPRIWDKWARKYDHVIRCDLVAKESEVEVPVTDNRIKFQDLSPDYVSMHGGGIGPRWANVIEIGDYIGSDDVASIIPEGLPELARILGTVGDAELWTTREGIVIGSRFSDWTYNWHLPDSIDVFMEWMNERGCEFEVSGTGKIGVQLVRSLGGIWGVNLIDNEEILNHLNRMAHGQIEVEKSEIETEKTKLRVRAKTMSWKDWWGLLLRVNNNSIQVAKNHIELLVARGVLKMGLRLQCSVCSQHTWFHLGGLSEYITCERCHQTFAFPSTDPPIKDDWHYRAMGPFSVENYAQGNYCIALALNFLSTKIRSEITWLPSFELTKLNGATLEQRKETDFGIFWRQRRFERTDPILILGECRTNNPFSQKDVSWMKTLGEAFPGSVLAFCTLRRELDQTEKNRLSTLARRGRRRLYTEKWYNPVLVLTGIELFGDFGPPSCWKDLGPDFDKVAEAYRGYEGIQDLCDATQQLHLGMESYQTWLDKKRRKRADLKSKKKN